MSTGASIARMTPGDIIQATRVNWDGYLSGVGKSLLEHFDNDEAVDRLFNDKEIRSIDGDNVEFYPEQCYNEYDEIDEWRTSHGECFGYIFIDGVWHYHKGGNVVRSLTFEAVANDK